MFKTSSWKAGRRWLTAAAIAVAAAASIPAGAQQENDPVQLLEDFVFYSMTANPELAAASAEALMSAGLSNAELAELLDEKGKTTVVRFDGAVARAQRINNIDLEQMAADLATRIEGGRLDLARDSDRIDQAIQMLIGNQRERVLAKRRLIAAGEFAVPYLLRVITEGNNERLKNQCISVLQEIGRQAVTPLTAALPKLGDPASERIVCDILGSIAYAHAAPTLRAVAEDPNRAAPVRDAAFRALRRIDNPDVLQAPLSSLYTVLGQQYFSEAESLIAFPTEPSNNVWSYDAFVGLQATPVPTEIFSEVMAMMSASDALQVDPANGEARSLFVAANLKRENELPAGATDPVFGDSRFSPDFYATVFGTETSMEVLGMAIDIVNTPLVRDAIRALSQTTGGANLFAIDRDRQPLLEALQYPDRRAQYEAALTLAGALPPDKFSGDFAVVPLLASAVRTGGQSFAVVIADDAEDRRVIANMLEAIDFDVAGAGTDVNEVRNAIAEAVGVDLVLVKAADATGAMEAINDLRLIPKTGAAPILMQATALDMSTLRPEYRGDQSVLVGRAGVDEEQFRAQVGSVLDQAAGGRITEAESEVYAIEALAALRDIAVSGTPAYDVADAESSLVDALQVRSGGTQRLVADVLALIDSDRAQSALFDAALSTADDEQFELLLRVAESVRRYGDRAEQRHIDSIIKLLASAEGQVAEAAAQVHGALNLPATDAVKLIP